MLIFFEIHMVTFTSVTIDIDPIILNLAANWTVNMTTLKLSKL